MTDLTLNDLHHWHRHWGNQGPNVQYDVGGKMVWDRDFHKAAAEVLNPKVPAEPPRAFTAEQRRAAMALMTPTTPPTAKAEPLWTARDRLLRYVEAFEERARGELAAIPAVDPQDVAELLERSSPPTTTLLTSDPALRLGPALYSMDGSVRDVPVTILAVDGDTAWFRWGTGFREECSVARLRNEDTP